MVRFQTFQRYLKIINSPSFIKSSLSSEIPGTKTCLKSKQVVSYQIIYVQTLKYVC